MMRIRGTVFENLTAASDEVAGIDQDALKAGHYLTPFTRAIHPLSHPAFRPYKTLNIPCITLTSAPWRGIT